MVKGRVPQPRKMGIFGYLASNQHMHLIVNLSSTKEMSPVRAAQKDLHVQQTKGGKPYTPRPKIAAVDDNVKCCWYGIGAEDPVIVAKYGPGVLMCAPSRTNSNLTIRVMQ
jgi:hypothetical protein